MITVDTILKDFHDLSNLENLCRMCGKNQSSFTPIFDETNRYNYYRVIQQHFRDDLPVSKTDILPLKMCAKCLKLMMSWHEFYLECMKVEKKFKRLIDKFSLTQDPEKRMPAIVNDVEVIEVSVDDETYDFFNENTGEFDISNVNIKESTSFVDTNDLSHFDDLNDSSSSGHENNENKTTKTAETTETIETTDNHSETLVEISDKIVEATFESIKLEDPSDIADPDIVKIELIEPSDMEFKTEHNEPIDDVESTPNVPKPSNYFKTAPTNDDSSKTYELLSEEVEQITFVERKLKESLNNTSDSLSRVKPKRTPRRTSRICHLCGKHYNTESGFRHHLIMHEEPSYSCHECGNVFYEAQNLKKHLAAIHSDERPFQCHLCGNKYKRKDVLQEHIKRVHDGIKRVWNMETLKKYRKKQQSVKKYKYTCPYCDKVLGTKGYLNDHINGVHTKEQLYKCNECDMSFTRKTTFKYHFKRAHILKKNVLEPRGTFLKDCEYCGLQFQVKKYYEQHIATKHDHTFKCAYCEAVFKEKYQLTNHIDTAHAEEISRCQFCNKGFAEELLLKRHIYICHTDRKPYECNDCGYKANKKATLAVHIRRHTGEKPYQCDMCPRRFTQSVDYRKHRANHFKKNS